MDELGTSFVAQHASVPLVRLGGALAVGLILGLERGWRERDMPEGTRAAGIRTFALAALAAGAAALDGGIPGAVVLGIFLLVVGALLVVNYHRKPEQDRDLTTEVALLLTVVLGGLAGYGEPGTAIASAVVAALLLNLKQPLHQWVRAMSEVEVRAVLRFLVLAAVVLPVLPDRGFGPDGVINPYRLWLLVIFVSGISFGGYVATKLIGPRTGTLLTGIVGALASSTATTVAFAELARRNPSLARTFAAGIIAASGVMAGRVLALAAIVSPQMALALAWPIVPMIVVSVLLTFLLYRQSSAAKVDDAGDLGNPLDVWKAIGFTALIAVILVAATWLQERFGDIGLYAVAAISGLADVDAITLSAGNLADRTATPLIGAKAVLIAVASNTAVKACFAWGIGGRALGSIVAVGFAAIMSVGFGALVLFG